MKRPSIFPAAAAVIATVVLFTAPRAHAHRYLDHAEPKVGSEVATSPREIKVWFTGAVDASGTTIEVFDSNGTQVDKKDCHQDPNDKALMIVSVPELAAGTYKVTWHATSTDTHKTKGDFQFTVKAKG